MIARLALPPSLAVHHKHLPLEQKSDCERDPRSLRLGSDVPTAVIHSSHLPGLITAIDAQYLRTLPIRCVHLAS